MEHDRRPGWESSSFLREIFALEASEKNEGVLE